MKKTLINVALFFLINALGFSMSTAIVLFVTTFNFVDLTAAELNVEQFKYDIFYKHSVTWMVCALFSFSFFFLKGMWRYIMLLAPVVIPFIYTTMNMVKYL